MIMEKKSNRKNEIEEKLYTEIPNIFVQSNNNKPSILKLLNNNKSVAFLKVIQDCSLIRETSVFNIEFILSKCGLTQRTSNIKMVRDFLSSMIKLNLIDLLGEDPNTLKTSKMIECKLNVFEMNKDGNKTGYFKLLDSEWNAIMNYQGESDRFNLLNVFCSIKSRMYYNITDVCKHEVSFPTHINICESVGISGSNILKKYLDVLEKDLDLIAIGRPGDMMIHGERMASNNIYILKSNKLWKKHLSESVREYTKIKESEGFEFVGNGSKLYANKLRSLSGTINAFNTMMRKGVTLNEEQAEKLQNAINEKEMITRLREEMDDWGEKEIDSKIRFLSDYR